MPQNPKSRANLIPPKKGEVRNPKGRGKGVPNSRTVIRKWLSIIEKVQDPFDKSGTKKIEVSGMDAIVLAQVSKARKGDLNAFNALMDRVEGKPKNFLDITTDDESLNDTAAQAPPDLSKLSTEELRTLAKLQKKIKSK